jgi:hypothetical protein
LAGSVKDLPENTFCFIDQTGRSGCEIKLIATADVGRVSVSAEIGRHGGRPYVGGKPKFLFLIKLAALQTSGTALMKLHEKGKDEK